MTTEETSQRESQNPLRGTGRTSCLIVSLVLFRGLIFSGLSLQWKGDVEKKGPHRSLRDTVFHFTGPRVLVESESKS